MDNNNLNNSDSLDNSGNNTNNTEKVGANIPDILTVVTCALILFVLALAVFILPDEAFSEQENRVLQQFPAISENSFLDRLPGGKFTSDMAEYYADQFPLRDVFVGLKGAAEIGLLKGENNGVILGGNNYLITKDANQNMEQTVDRLRKNIDAISGFADAMNEMKIPVTLAAAGRSIDALDMYLPAAYPRDNSARLWASFNGLADIAPNIRRLDLLAPLKQLIEREDRGQLYYRTDHHWTTLGAYYAYVEILKSFNREDGFEPLSLRDFNIEAVSNNFYGTTWSKAGMKWINSDTIYFFRYDGDEEFITEIKDNGRRFNGFYDFDYLELKDKYSAFLSGNNARVDITNPSAKTMTEDGEEIKRPKLLLIKDSFAHSAVPFLAYHYDMIILDLRYYTDSVARLVFQENIDRVLFLHNIQNLSEDDTYGILEYGVEATLHNYIMSQYPIRRIFVNGNPIDDYKIIYPVEENERRQQPHIDAANSLRDVILTRAGVELEVISESDFGEWTRADKVIVLTKTGLPADNNLMRIATEGSGLVLRCNIGDDPTGYAVRRLIDRYIRNATGSFNFGGDFVFSDSGDDVIIIMPSRD
ncbi:MAG: DHHW family protein [Oscillospiraceae bacterium]|nr:DHHW family protein [Oscillospiraceae bacterium]